MLKIYFLPQAIHDLDEQANYIAKDNPQAACDFYDACHTAIRLLSKMPKLGVKYISQNPRLRGLRFIPITAFLKHIIFYRVHQNKITIVRILYSTRNISRIFG